MAVVFRHHAGQNTIRMGGHSLRCHALQRGGRGILLPAAVPPAGTGQAVPLDPRVSHLARHAVAAVVDLTVMDDARAHAGTQRDGHKALAVPACAYIVFRQRRAVGVVLDIQRNGQVVMEQLPQRYVPQRQVAGIAGR